MIVFSIIVKNDSWMSFLDFSSLAEPGIPARYLREAHEYLYYDGPATWMTHARGIWFLFGVD